MTVPVVAPLVVATIACVTDLRTRRIPNVLTFGAAAGACGFYLADRGLGGLGWSAAGWLVGGLLFLPLFALRGLGGGDVKLLAALGAWMGTSALLPIVLLSSLIGAVVGGAFLAIRGHDRATPIPFGPFIAAAGWVQFVFGDQIMAVYRQTFGLA